MKLVGKVLLVAGPWLGALYFVWRQQTLEATLSDWVASANAAVETAIGKLTDAATERVSEP